MNTNCYKIVNIMLFFISLSFSITSSSSKNFAKLNQVKIITNPATPINGISEYYLEEVFSIGDVNEDSNNFFSCIVDLEVDDLDNIYVLDYGKKNIRKYNSSGKHIQTINSEFENGKNLKNPVAIAINHKGKLIVGDEGSLLVQIFSKEGNFLKNFSIQCAFLTDLFIDSKDNIVLANSYIQFENGVKGTEFKLYDEDGSFLHTICDKKVPQNIRTINPMLFDGVIDNYDHLYLANLIDTSNYQIEVYDLQGKLLSKISKVASKIPYTFEEKIKWEKNKIQIFGKSRFQKFIQPFALPFYKPLISGIYISNENTLWIKTIVDQPNNNTMFDEFDKEGRFIKKVILKGANLYKPIFIKNRIYDFSPPYEKLQQIKVYLVNKYDR